MENIHSDQIVFDIQAEEHIIVVLLENSDNVPRIVPQLKAEDFYNEAFGVLYEAIVALCGDGSKATVGALTHHLRENGDQLAPLITGMRHGDQGVQHFIFMFSRSAADTFNIDYYIRKIKLCSLKRTMLWEAQKLELICRDKKSTKAQLNSMIAGMDLLAAESEKVEMVDLKHAIQAGVTDPAKKGTLKAKAGVTCGIPEWDDLTGGLRPGSLNVIAARPSVGKSTLATIFAEGIVNETDKPVILFSLEMTTQSWAWREFSRRSGITERELRLRSNHGLSGKEEDTIDQADKSIKKDMYLIVDKPNLTIDQIIGISKAQHVKTGLGGIVIDYIQLMKAEGESRSRHEEVGDISGKLKQLAKELNIPIIVLGQLNRSGDPWDPKVSQMSQADKISMDADTVTLLHRKADEPIQPQPGMRAPAFAELKESTEAERDCLASQDIEELVLTIEKARDGQRGVVKVEHHKGLFIIESRQMKQAIECSDQINSEFGE
ncbi:MAG: replicative DNA helicase [Pirellulales bacterium]